MSLASAPCDTDIVTSAQATQLQAWVGGSSSPHAWTEVYRGSRDGFTPTAFHTRCDEKPRLLIVAKDKDAGWLFGGFTAVGFLKAGGDRLYADPAAFVFSLTNPAGRPERLASTGDGKEIYYLSSHLVRFGWNDDLAIKDGCASDKSSVSDKSFTGPGHSFASPSVTGTHPMAKGQVYISLAELVAWIVPR